MTRVLIVPSCSSHSLQDMKLGFRRSLSRRSLMPLVASVLMLSLLALQGTQVWAASASRVVVSTNHLAVGLTFPGSAYPGQRIRIGADITAQSNARIVRFSIDIFVYVNGQLVRLASQTIMTDKTVQTADNWQTSLVVIIPANAQPGPLAGRLTEIWQATPNYYLNYYPPNYNYYPSNLNYYPSNYGRWRYPASECSLYQDNAYYNSAYYKNAYSNYNSPYYGYPYYNTYTYNTQPYVCQPSPYYEANYRPNYAPNYASQASQRTFTLTYILG